MASTAAPRAASSLLWEHHHHYPMDWDTLQGCPCCLSLLPVGSCCGVLGCPQRPFVVSWGCLCFPAPLGASARAGAQPDFLHPPPPPPPQSPGLQSPPGHVQLSRLLLAAAPAPAVAPSGFLQHGGFAVTLPGVFPSQGPLEHPWLPKGFSLFLTQISAASVQASPFSLRKYPVSTQVFLCCS